MSFEDPEFGVRSYIINRHRWSARISKKQRRARGKALRDLNELSEELEMVVGLARTRDGGERESGAEGDRWEDGANWLGWHLKSL